MDAVTYENIRYSCWELNSGQPSSRADIVSLKNIATEFYVPVCLNQFKWGTYLFCMNTSHIVSRSKPVCRRLPIRCNCSPNMQLNRWHLPAAATDMYSESRNTIAGQHDVWNTVLVCWQLLTGHQSYYIVSTHLRLWPISEYPMLGSVHWLLFAHAPC